MQYDTVAITLRDVQTDKYLALIEQMISMGLYGKAAIKIKEGQS